MKRKNIFSLLFVLFSIFSVNASISYVTQESSWIKIYDKHGNLNKSISSSNGYLIGYNSKIFILEGNSWYYIYDENGKRVKTLSKSGVGEIISVSGTGFIAESGSWIYFYDNAGNKIRSKQK